MEVKAFNRQSKLPLESQVISSRSKSTTKVRVS